MKISDVPEKVYRRLGKKIKPLYRREFLVEEGMLLTKEAGTLIDELLPKGSHLLLSTLALDEGRGHKIKSDLELYTEGFREDWEANPELDTPFSEWMASYVPKVDEEEWCYERGFWIKESVEVESVMAHTFTFPDNDELCLMVFSHMLDDLVVDCLRSVTSSGRPDGGVGFWEKEIHPGPFHKKPERFSW